MQIIFEFQMVKHHETSVYNRNVKNFGGQVATLTFLCDTRLFSGHSMISLYVISGPISHYHPTIQYFAKLFLTIEWLIKFGLDLGWAKYRLNGENYCLNNHLSDMTFWLHSFS